jgi:hypothetical protein
VGLWRVGVAQAYMQQHSSSTSGQQVHICDRCAPLAEDWRAFYVRRDVSYRTSFDT